MTSIDSPATPLRHSDTVGKRVYFVGHSFHMFIVRPLITLAKEAGIKGHWAEGWDMIGGSTPRQHWERDGDDNEVKRALRSGRVEVLTLASNVILPEPAIDWFADFAIDHNPDVRVIVQQSWGDASTGLIMRARHGGTELDLRAVPSNEARDTATAADLAEQREANRRQRATLRKQLRSIDARRGRDFTAMVPAGEAVIRVRELVLAGDLPGVTRQSDLFRDALGHATQPVMDVVTYMWFAAIYGIDPAGAVSLVEPDDPTAAERHGLLKKVAWDVLRDEPHNGL